MKQIESKHYIRITKRQAIKEFNQDHNIYLLPCNMHPENMWMAPGLIDRIDLDGTFEQLINAYEYYNCNNQTGKYTAFYIRKGLD